ncbi:MAG TPA: Ig-like domain repeat protein [Mycobacteriales bacterium]|nr:Ig-like domain repeat protein [Mycobacteriales bacterium]
MSYNATVTPSTATGTVTFTTGTGASQITLCTATLLGGSGSCSPNRPSQNAPTGTDTITGTYGGNSSLLNSSGTTTLTVAQANSIVAVTATPSSDAFGQSVTYSVTVSDTSSGSIATPTGSVALVATSGSTSAPLCTVAALDSNGKGSCSSNAAPVGSPDTITGSYSGDPNFHTSTGTTNLTVSKADSATALTLTPSTASFGDTVTYKAVVTDATANSTGTPNAGHVNFTLENGSQMCSQPVDNTGTASCMVSNTPIGNHTVTATYVGDGDFNQSSTTAPLTVTKATPTTAITVTPSASPAVFGQSVTYAATVSSSAGTPTGQVIFTTGPAANPVTLCTATLSNGSGSCTSRTAPAGTDTITGSYGGDSTFAGSTSNPQSLTVTKAATSTTVSTNPTSAAPSQSVTYMATVADTSPNSTATPTGDVVFSINGTTICQATLSNGSGQCTSAAAPTGTDTVQGVYNQDNADTNFNSSTGLSQLLVSSSLHSTSTSVLANPSTSVFGQTVNYSATVTSTSSGTPTGKVTFSVGATILCVAQLDTNAQATCPANNAPVGTDTVSGQYGGDSMFTGSSGTTTETVSKANTSTTVTAQPGSVTSGQTVTYSATVSDTSPSSTGTPTGTVQFTIGSTMLCTATLTSGHASCMANNAPGGTDSVTGTYSGDGNFNTSVGGTTVTVAQAAGGFVSEAPNRVLDTRNGTGATGPVGAGQTVTLDLSQAVPSSATAVALNVTAVNASTSTFVTVWPDGQSRPTASNLNVGVGQTIANLVIVQLGQGQKVDLFNQRGSLDLVADLGGYFDPSNTTGYGPQNPVRVLDTRNGTGGATGPIGPGQTVRLNLSNFVTPSATAVVLNVTAVTPTAPTFVTVWPDGTSRPTASSLNVTAGQTLPNLVIVKLGAGDFVDLYNHSGKTQLVADLEGVFDPSHSPRLLPRAPERIVDTRNGTGGTSGPLVGGATMSIDFTGALPAGARAVVLNITAVGASADTFVTVWPGGASRPNASNLNVPAGGTLPNLVIVQLGSGDVVNIFNHSGSVNIVADLEGVFT